MTFSRFSRRSLSGSSLHARIQASLVPSLLIAGAAVALASLPAGCSSSSSSGATNNADGGGDSATPADRHVVVLFTSDEHSHILSFSPELDDYPAATAAGTGPLLGGVARRQVVISQLRKAASDAGKDSILVSAGDNQMGCLPMLGFEGQSNDYGALATLGYDVTTLGNHELDFGPKALAASINTALGNKAVPPIVASNIHFSATDAADDDLAALYGTGTGAKPIEPYRILTTKAGVKIGILGFVGVNASHVAPNKAPLTFSVPIDLKNDGNVATNLPAVYKDLQPVVDTLRNVEKVDLVVALSHAGLVDVTSPAAIAAGEDTNICENVSGIDFIVSGHAHQHDPTPHPTANKTTMKPCLVLNGGAFGEEVGTVDFTIPGDSTKGVTWDATSQKLVPVNESIVPDPTVAAMATSIITNAEAASIGTTSLAGLLSHALGQTIADDPSKTGDLYFHPLGTTEFDLADGQHPIIWLSADATLQESDALVTELGITATQGLRRIGRAHSIFAEEG